MKIEPIIYDTTREIYSVEDKLSIASIFLFCWKLGNKTLSELLYTDNHKKFIDNLIQKYSEYDIDLTVRLDDKNVNNSFYKTIEKVKKKYDDNGYLEALFNKDEFAIVIEEIVNYNFDKFEFKKIINNINKQLRLF